MSAKPDNPNETYEEQLTELESRLKTPEHDEAMLGEVGLAMRNLLIRSGESEAHIRQILERQFDQGNLRRESYELVEKLLGKIVAERGEPAPDEPHNDEPDSESPYVDTTVLEQSDQPPAPPAVTEQLQVGSVLRDRYLLKEEVSEGSMGTVYKALDRRLAEAGDANPFVAIKVLSPKLSRNGAALRALQQEAAKGRCLAHPNIVRFFDLDRDDDLFFIVMEWLEGRSLSKILDENRGNALDLATAIDITAQTARALSYAHQRGVVHADVKPGNIIISPEGQVKLIDFGVARVRQKENEGKSRFDPNVMRAGSPAYSSMQVLTGEDPVPADDVFSLACLLYRLIAGYRVFGPRNAADAAQEGMEPQRPQEINEEQWSALKKALSYSRVTRFESPKAFMDAFGTAPIKPAPAKSSAKELAKQAVAKAPLPDMTPEAQVELAPQPEPEPTILSANETTQVSVDVPMRAEREPIMFDGEDEEPPRRSPLRLVVVGIILLATVAVVLRPDLIETLGVDESIESIAVLIDDLSGAGAESTLPPTVTGAEPGEAIEELDALPETDIAETTIEGASDNVVEELVIDSVDGSVAQVVAPETATAAESGPDEIAAVAAEPEPEPLPPPMDFSTLPEPDLLLSLIAEGEASLPVGSLTIREDSGAAIVDLVRDGDLSQTLEVQLVETRFTGNQSAWESGQYQVQDEGLVTFGPGQPRARTMITMRSNPVRESDREVVLSVRDAETRQEDLASIRLTLEDDDQRAFEASLPPNTVGFTVNQISVREFDPAVQVDIVRYRPNNTALEIGYTLTDVTATEGQDYFAPGLPVIYFGPGQRSARILIPLGQDARVEQDEAFMLELDTDSAPVGSNIFTQIAVMIRDDDS